MGTKKTKVYLTVIFFNNFKSQERDAGTKPISNTYLEVLTFDAPVFIFMLVQTISSCLRAFDLLVTVHICNDLNDTRINTCLLQQAQCC